MKNLRFKPSLAAPLAAAILSFSSAASADHLQTPTYDSTTLTVTIPSIRMDNNPNIEFSDLSFVLLGAENEVFDSPAADGTPAYQTIRVNLSAAQETAAGVMSAGSCRGVVRIVHATRHLEAVLDCNDIAVTGAHIHNAAAGSDGGIVYFLETNSSGSGTVAQLSRHDCTARTNPGASQVEGSCLNGGVSGRTQLSTTEYAELMAGNFYFNVHTAANPAGELRGQITPARTLSSSVRCSQSESLASMGGMGVVAENNADGDDYATCSGRVTIDLSSLEVDVLLSPDLEASVAAAHIHQQDSGSTTGGVIISLSDDGEGNLVAAQGTTITSDQLKGFVANQWYFNLHTANNPGGATRAQVTPAIE